MAILDAKNLAGVWSAVPTPWTDRGTLDERILGRNCEKLASAGVAGIYTTDSDGEFYAIELPEFRRLARTFGRIMHSLRVPAQMGVTWSHTRGVIDRMRAACAADITAVH